MTSAFEGWNVPTLGAGDAAISVTETPAASNNSAVSLPLPVTALIFSGKLLSDTSIFRGSKLRDHARPLPVGPEPLTSSLASPPSLGGRMLLAPTPGGSGFNADERPRTDLHDGRSPTLTSHFVKHVFRNAVRARELA